MATAPGQPAQRIDDKLWRSEKEKLEVGSMGVWFCSVGPFMMC
jgi:hypothetical protein